MRIFIYRRRTCRLALNPPFSRSSVLAPKVSIRYLPTTGSPFTSPESTDRTYAKTRSSIEVMPLIDRSRASKSVTGWVVYCPGAWDAAEARRSTRRDQHEYWKSSVNTHAHSFQRHETAIHMEWAQRRNFQVSGGFLRVS